MDFLPSEVARLVLGLLEELCPSAAQLLLEESPDLAELRQLRARGRRASCRPFGHSLHDILTEYCAANRLVDDAVRELNLESTGAGFIGSLRTLIALDTGGRVKASDIDGDTRPSPDGPSPPEAVGTRHHTCVQSPIGICTPEASHNVSDTYLRGILHSSTPHNTSDPGPRVLCSTATLHSTSDPGPLSLSSHATPQNTSDPVSRGFSGSAILRNTSDPEPLDYSSPSTLHNISDPGPHDLSNSAAPHNTSDPGPRGLSSSESPHNNSGHTIRGILRNSVRHSDSDLARAGTSSWGSPIASSSALPAISSSATLSVSDSALFREPASGRRTRRKGRCPVHSLATRRHHLAAWSFRHARDPNRAGYLKAEDSRISSVAIRSETRAPATAGSPSLDPLVLPDVATVSPPVLVDSPTPERPDVRSPAQELQKRSEHDYVGDAQDVDNRVSGSNSTDGCATNSDVVEDCAATSRDTEERAADLRDIEERITDSRDIEERITDSWDMEKRVTCSQGPEEHVTCSHDIEECITYSNDTEEVGKGSQGTEMRATCSRGLGERVAGSRNTEERATGFQDPEERVTDMRDPNNSVAYSYDTEEHKADMWDMKDFVTDSNDTEEHVTEPWDTNEHTTRSQDTSKHVTNPQGTERRGSVPRGSLGATASAVGPPVDEPITIILHRTGMVQLVPIAWLLSSVPRRRGRLGKGLLSCKMIKPKVYPVRGCSVLDMPMVVRDLMLPTGPYSRPVTSVDVDPTTLAAHTSRLVAQTDRHAGPSSDAHCQQGPSEETDSHAGRSSATDHRRDGRSPVKQARSPPRKLAHVRSVTWKSPVRVASQYLAAVIPGPSQPEPLVAAVTRSHAEYEEPAQPSPACGGQPDKNIAANVHPGQRTGKRAVRGASCKEKQTVRRRKSKEKPTVRDDKSKGKQAVRRRNSKEKQAACGRNSTEKQRRGRKSKGKQTVCDEIFQQELTVLNEQLVEEQYMIHQQLKEHQYVLGQEWGEERDVVHQQLEINLVFHEMVKEEHNVLSQELEDAKYSPNRESEAKITALNQETETEENALDEQLEEERNVVDEWSEQEEIDRDEDREVLEAKRRSAGRGWVPRIAVRRKLVRHPGGSARTRPFVWPEGGHRPSLVGDKPLPSGYCRRVDCSAQAVTIEQPTSQPVNEWLEAESGGAAAEADLSYDSITVDVVSLVGDVVPAEDLHLSIGSAHSTEPFSPSADGARRTADVRSPRTPIRPTCDAGDSLRLPLRPDSSTTRPSPTTRHTPLNGTPHKLLQLLDGDHQLPVEGDRRACRLAVDCAAGAPGESPAGTRASSARTAADCATPDSPPADCQLGSSDAQLRPGARRREASGEGGWPPPAAGCCFLSPAAAAPAAPAAPADLAELRVSEPALARSTPPGQRPLYISLTPQTDADGTPSGSALLQSVETNRTGPRRPGPRRRLLRPGDVIPESAVDNVSRQHSSPRADRDVTTSPGLLPHVVLEDVLTASSAAKGSDHRQPAAPRRPSASGDTPGQSAGGPAPSCARAAAPAATPTATLATTPTATTSARKRPAAPLESRTPPAKKPTRSTKTLLKSVNIMSFLSKIHDVGS